MRVVIPASSMIRDAYVSTLGLLPLPELVAIHLLVAAGVSANAAMRRLEELERLGYVERQGKVLVASDRCLEALESARDGRDLVLDDERQAEAPKRYMHVKARRNRRK